MNMGEMIDRVAKAIYDAMDIADGLNMTAAETYASAAIAAMRQPTDAMVNAGRDMYPPDQDCIPVWETMIDEALR